jgi:hypothetical protein
MYSIYMNVGRNRTLLSLMFLLRVQRVAVSWALARVLDLYLNTELYRHKALLSHFMATQVGLLTKERDGLPAIP